MTIRTNMNLNMNETDKLGCLFLYSPKIFLTFFSAKYLEYFGISDSLILDLKWLKVIVHTVMIKISLNFGIHI